MQFSRGIGASWLVILPLQKSTELLLKFSVTRHCAAQTTREVTCARAELRDIKIRFANQRVILQAKHLKFRLEFFDDLRLRTCIKNRKRAAHVCPRHVNGEQIGQ